MLVINSFSTQTSYENQTKKAITNTFIYSAMNAFLREQLEIYFMEHPGIVLPRDTILNAVWEYDYTGDVRTIDTLVKQLRKKMGEGCNYIRTVYGVGYIFGEDIHEN